MANSKKDRQGEVNTGGGAYVGGNVSTGGGDFVGRDKKMEAGERGVVIGGSVSGSTIITGDGNVVGRSEVRRYFQPVYLRIEQADLPAEDKADLKDEVRALEAEVAKGEQADAGALGKRLRNIRRIAPDILDVALAALQGPAAGFSTVARKVAARMAQETQ